jgi:hypothetical protein
MGPSGSLARVGNQTRPRYKLSAGGRARNIPEVAELLVARALGRNLTPLQGCVVQIFAIAILCFMVWVLYSSGLIIRIIEPFVRLYLSQTQFAPPSSPVP